MSRAEEHLDLHDAVAVADTLDVLTGAEPQQRPSLVVSEHALDPVDQAEHQAAQQALAAELAQSRQVLDALTADLRAVDSELESFATEREQHRVLLDLCSSLDKLGQIGGASLFWGEGADKQASTEHVRRVRARVEEFNQRIGKVEDRRNAIIDRIKSQESQASFMEDVLFEALEEEERRKQEWIVEREISKLPAYKAAMPWTHGGEEDKRFRKSMSTALLLCLIFAIALPFIRLPESILKPEVEVPERIVKLLIESRPKPVTPTREPPKPKLEEKVAEEKPVKEAPKLASKPDKETKTQPTEEPKATEQGILAFREKLAGLPEDQALARLGAQAQIDNSADSAPAQRAMLTTNAPGSSGGINLASLSRGVGGSGKGGAGMAGVQVTRVASGIGGIGKPGADRPLSGDGVSASRTDEEIQIVFDRYKASLYRLYNKELRKDPSLRGQMVLKLTIEPDGSVSMCALQASDMNAPELGAQVVERVKTINFGAKEVPAITILYPIDFLPAA